SQTIGQLERQFDLMLIDRKLKPLALTVAGTVLCDQAGQLIEEARCVVPKVRESAALKLPIVRIGPIDSTFPLLAPALGVELRLHADQLSILSGLTDAHRQGLLNRSLDISIATDRGCRRAGALSHSREALYPAPAARPARQRRDRPGAVRRRAALHPLYRAL